MAIDMGQFRQVFFEESFEGLDIMESGLLNLDLGAVDNETINAIFRAAHSIKGGSGTFGFGEVAAFTHVIETLLDEMRAGQRAVTTEAVNLLLAAVDCLRAMLGATKAGEDIDRAAVGELHQRLEALHRGDSATVAAATSAQTPAAAQTTKAWCIRFSPHPHLLASGNDPYRLLRELAGLGELMARADLSGLPPFAELEPEQSYLAWTIHLSTDAEREQIKEVFDWVEGDCDLSISPLESGNNEIARVGRDAEPIAASPVVEPPAPVQPAPPAPPLAAAPAPAERRSGEDRRQGERRAQAAQDTGSIRVNIDKIDSLINLVGELVITQSMLSRFAEHFDMSQLEKLHQGLNQLARNTRQLQEQTMQIRMLPISFSFSRFPRLVHDLSGKLGKQVELKLSGEQTELDKTVLEKIGDPLVHLVRNSLDHGIESPEARRAAGKPETALIHLNAFHQGGNIVIEVSDDGAGLNKEKILAKARKNGLVKEGETLTDEQIHNLIFQPGFSTAEVVSDVSGRGVGLDVVRRNIKDLGGYVEVRSVPGQGSTFTIRLPLTVAILEGQLVRVGRETYIIPLVSIVESLQVRLDQVNSVAGQTELYRLRDEYIPIARLYQLFGVQADSTELRQGLLVVVEADGQRIGLFVDDLLGQQQVVIKSLEANFHHVRGLAGATILGDGTVALILDITGLIRLCHHDVGATRIPAQVAA